MEEKFDYNWQDLIKNFDAFRTTKGRIKAQELEKAKEKGEDITQDIANYAYADKNGNENYESGDGFKYRGRGFIRITGKNKYQELSGHFNKHMKIDNEDIDVDWLNNPDLLASSSKFAIVSALTFWRLNKISKVASQNSAKCVTKVTELVNPQLKALTQRLSVFNKAVEVLQVNECVEELEKDNYGEIKKETIQEDLKPEILSFIKSMMIENTWNVVITEKYTGSACLHEIGPTSRANCRRGRIEVYDHNYEVALTITDCLLEGTKGPNRMLKKAIHHLVFTI